VPFDDVPDLVEVVPRHITGLLVLDPEVERLALVGPLAGTIITGDDGKVADLLVVLRGDHF
jgi:hypothetical protein